MTSAFFTYDKPKVIQALRFHFISRREIKITIIIVNLFAIFSAVMYFMRKISPVAFLFASGLWFILMISFWFALPYIIYKKAATFKDRFRVRFDDEGMTLETERGSRGWPWQKFSTYMESPFFFHIYFDPRSFFLIPKKAFDEDGIAEARKYLKDRIGKS